ncbi:MULTISPECIES: hypothetical protein [Thermomonosporaceae]|uniref:hypothetical protein n=1 Tax=Thermomonosporaceae TaxID=2012 RepID=UPI00255B40B7|nr:MULTISPECIES: hypothetical protein [Thermomonosporaceae]MDL4773106.1 hypothetical protein [Actinomadura xylanilytica]
MRTPSARSFTFLAAASAVAASVLALAGPASADVSVQGVDTYASTLDGEAEARWWHDGDKLVVHDVLADGWGSRAQLQTWNSALNQWMTAFTCTDSNSSDGTKTCSQNLVEGTPVRIHLWQYKGTSTRLHTYSPQGQA